MLKLIVIKKKKNTKCERGLNRVAVIKAFLLVFKSFLCQHHRNKTVQSISIKNISDDNNNGGSIKKYETEMHCSIFGWSCWKKI